MHLAAFLLLGIGDRAAVFQVCQICAFNQSKQVHLIDGIYIFYMLERLQLNDQYLVIKMQLNAEKNIEYLDVYTAGHEIVTVDRTYDFH